MTTSVRSHVFDRPRECRLLNQGDVRNPANFSSGKQPPITTPLALQQRRPVHGDVEGLVVLFHGFVQQKPLSVAAGRVLVISRISAKASLEQLRRG